MPFSSLSAVLGAPLVICWVIGVLGSVRAESPAADRSADSRYDPATGCWHFGLSSPCQSGSTSVQVILPDPLDREKRYPVLYVLPVEPEGSYRFGNGMAEAKKADVANKYQVICVAPSFKVVPWYGNHATDLTIRQDDFMVQTLIPEIDRRYPTVAQQEGRWLLGFSKSGWGACTLLLRHPEVFGYAATWDSPFLLKGDDTGKGWGPIGIDKVYGTKEAFLKQLPTTLSRDRTASFQGRPRLILGVGKDWRSHVEGMHALLEQLQFPHLYLTDLMVWHRWDTGWFAPLTEELVKMASPTPEQK
ncbi:MAG: alpha/beta hydrolase-fold protein [Verrucomicrobium sp.]